MHTFLKYKKRQKISTKNATVIKRTELRFENKTQDSFWNEYWNVIDTIIEWETVIHTYLVNDYAAVALSIYFGGKITRSGSQTHTKKRQLFTRANSLLITIANSAERNILESILRSVTSLMSKSATTILEKSKRSKPRVDVKFPIITIAHD